MSKNNVLSQSIAPTPVEVIRPVDTLIRDGVIVLDGERVTFKVAKGDTLTPSEIAGFIMDRESTGARFKVQARYAYYNAGLLPDGDKVREQIAQRLALTMSTSALAQLKSEACNLIPLALAADFKSPLSVLKDAVGSLALKDGKLAPMAQQSKAARALIPLLKAGEVTQAKVREIRKEHAPASTPRKPATDPKAKSADAEEATAYANAQNALSQTVKYATANRMNDAEAKPFVLMLNELARLLGYHMMPLANQPAPAPAKPAPTTK